MVRLSTLVLLSTLSVGSLRAGEPSGAETFRPSSERGLELILGKAYTPSELDESLFDNVWKVWPNELRERAGKATPAERRRMAFSRYGMLERPGRSARAVGGPPVSYVADENGRWASNCFLCHAGKVAGRTILGLPNSHVALKTFSEDLRWTRVLSGKGLTAADVGKMTFPLGGSIGTTNAVGFGVAYGAMRNPDMTVKKFRPIEFEHHDMDAPPWWNVRKKRNLYVDGFAPKSHRVLMTFVLAPENGPKQLEAWEEDFKHIAAYIESIEPPKYPWKIDAALAKQGQRVFESNCSSCHGTYGDDEQYEQQVIPWETVRTDPVRLRALTPEHRGWQAENWISWYGKLNVETEPKGYVAPPLDGIWASAPYFHNGSVPTLWHVLHSDERPKVWRRTEDGYDRGRVGLEIETFDAVPANADSASRRWYFDTTVKGKSAAGHLFPDELTDEEKAAVLEYLKTL